jgi:hypothetical protein
MPTVVAVIMRGGRAFSGGAAACAVGDVGADVTGHRGPSVARRNDRARAHVWLFRRGGAYLSVADDATSS